MIVEYCLSADRDRVWPDMLTALDTLSVEGWEAIGVVSLPSATIGNPIVEYVLLKQAIE